jgi:hypothetical protein
MSEDRRASQTNDQEFQRICLAAIWFEVVDSHEQRRRDRVNDKDVKAENKHRSPWRLSRLAKGFSSCRSNVRFDELPAKLFDKRASDQQIGKAPTIKVASPRNNYSSISRLDVLGLMKLNHPSAQFDIQSVANDVNLDNIRIFNLVRRRSKRHMMQPSELTRTCF